MWSVLNKCLQKENKCKWWPKCAAIQPKADEGWGLALQNLFCEAPGNCDSLVGC